MSAAAATPETSTAKLQFRQSGPTEEDRSPPGYRLFTSHTHNYEHDAAESEMRRAMTTPNMATPRRVSFSREDQKHHLQCMLVMQPTPPGAKDEGFSEVGGEKMY